MTATLSVSKGCFVFNKKKLAKRKTGKKSAKQELFCDDPWYLAYKKTWKWVEEEFETLHHETFSSVLNDLVSFVDTTYKGNEAKCHLLTVPTAALLTGINMPDHGALFSTLCDLLHKQISPHVATLHAHKCKTIRNAVEQMTSQFMNAAYGEDIDSDDSDGEWPVKVKKSQCNMLACQSWYHQLYPSYYSSHNDINTRKRKAVELKEEDFSEIADNHIKRLKVDDMFLHCIVESSKDSVRIHSSNHRESIRNKDKEEYSLSSSKISIGGSKDIKTPRKVSMLVEQNELENSQITPPKGMKNIELYLVTSTDKISKANEETPSKGRIRHFRTEEESHKLSKSPMTVSVLDDTLSHVSNSEKTLNKASRAVEMSEVLGRLQRSPAKEKREMTEVKSGKILAQESPYKKNRGLGVVHEGNLKSPKHILPTDNSPKIRNSCHKIPREQSKTDDFMQIEEPLLRTPTRAVRKIEEFKSGSNTPSPGNDKKLQELMKGESQKSPRTPKAELPSLVDMMNKSYNSDQNSPCTGDKDRDTERSQKTNANDSMQAEMSESRNCHTKEGKSKRLCESPKLVQKMVDFMYEVSEIDLKSSHKNNKNVQLTKLESERSQKSSKRESRLIDDSQRSSTTEKWVYEIDTEKAMIEKKIPRIVLRKLNEFNKVKSSPQNSSKKESVSEVLPLAETRCSAHKRKTVPVETHPQMKAVGDKERIKSIVFANNSVLSKYSSQNYGTVPCQWKKLIVIIPEFEKFPSKVLQDFILILRSSIPALPIVLIMGIATSVTAVHRSLPYRMSACLSIKVFQSPPSVQLLNSVLEQILFFPTFPFCLGNKTFSFLMDAFLYYDLSVKGFVQAMKFCMMEHFGGQDWKILCCEPDSLKENIKLTTEDITILRKLPSFSHYLNKLENERKKQKLINDDEYLQKTVLKLLKQFHKAKEVFHIALNCLNVLVQDLPKKPLGTQVRELYGIAASTAINKTSEYKECFQLLGFLSRDELVTKIEKIINILAKNKKEPVVNIFAEKICEYRKKVSEADICPASPQRSPTKAVVLEGRMNRHTFKEKLLQLSKRDHNISPFEKMRDEILVYLHSKVFPELLKPLTTLPLAEVVMFDNCESVRTHIVGAPRAAIHKALNDPQFYLECECCVQSEKNSILSSMPDTCIAYKLYRECGRLINLFDWLQAFSAIVNPQDDDAEEREVEPHVQARFTRAVAELQFMGFLKTSSRKVDHVTKLVFDGGF